MRRRWPQMLVCWTRVLAGRFRDPQVGARALAANLILCSRGALVTPLVFLFLFFVLRVLLRRDWLAATVFTLIGMAMGMGSDIPAIDVPLVAVFFLLVPLLLLRFALLALIAAMMTGAFFYSSALTLDTSRWYFGHSLIVLLLVAALAAWGFRTALAGRPLLKDETLGGSL